MGAEQSSSGSGGHQKEKTSGSQGRLGGLYIDPMAIHPAAYTSHHRRSRSSREERSQLRSVSTLQRDRERRRQEMEANPPEPVRSFTPPPQEGDHDEENENENDNEEEEELPTEINGVPIEVRVRPRPRPPRGVVEIEHEDQHIRINFDRLPEIKVADPPPLTAEELARIEEEENRIASPLYYGRQEYLARTSPNLKRHESLLSQHVFYNSPTTLAGSIASFGPRSPCGSIRNGGTGYPSPDSPGLIQLARPNFNDYVHSFASSTIGSELNYYHRSSSVSGSGNGSMVLPPGETSLVSSTPRTNPSRQSGANSPIHQPLNKKKNKRSTNVNGSVDEMALHPSNKVTTTPPKTPPARKAPRKRAPMEEDVWSSTSDELFHSDEDNEMLS